MTLNTQFSMELKDVIPSALSALSALLPNGAPIPSANGENPIPTSSHVLVLLVDGLGEVQLQDFGSESFLNTTTLDIPMHTQFPSTTPVALGSLGTGARPGAHGFVGASFFLPEEEQLFAPLKWKSTPHPLAMIPVAPLFEWASEHGIDVSSIAGEKHRNSGLTRSVLRGGEYLGCSDLTQMQRVVLDRIVNASKPALTYMYWPELDRVGHVHGPGSKPWLAEFTRIDAFISRIATMVHELPRRDISFVETSDHGMVACPSERQILIESVPKLMHGVTMVAGEPRARHLYTEPGAAVEVAAHWAELLGADFEVLLREQLLSAGMFPDLDPDFAGRIGDFMAISRTDASLGSVMDPRSSALLGQHGAHSEAEMRIPFRVIHSG